MDKSLYLGVPNKQCNAGMRPHTEDNTATTVLILTLATEPYN